MLLTATQQQNWDWFKHTSQWRESTFYKCNQQRRANQPTRFKPRKPPNSHPKQKEFAYNVVKVSFKNDHDNQIGILIEMLNIISR